MRKRERVRKQKDCELAEFYHQKIDSAAIMQKCMNSVRQWLNKLRHNYTRELNEGIKKSRVVMLRVPVCNDRRICDMLR